MKNDCRKLLCVSLLAIAHAGNAKTAPEYYHQGATNYVHGRWFEAKSLVTNGLALYPNDAKLLALNKLLEGQQPPPQQQQDQQKDQKEDQSKQQDQQSQQNQERQQQEEQKKDQQKPSDKQKQSPEQKPGGEGEDQKEQKEQKEGGQGAAQQLLQMTPEQAQRLLEAVKSDEKIMIFTPQTRTNRNNNRVLKDW